MYSVGSNAGTSAATWQRKPLASKSVTRRIPRRPPATPAQNSWRPVPIGVTAPMPVITTRRSISSLQFPRAPNPVPGASGQVPGRDAQTAALPPVAPGTWHLAPGTGRRPTLRPVLDPCLEAGERAAANGAGKKLADDPPARRRTHDRHQQGQPVPDRHPHGVV